MQPFDLDTAPLETKFIGFCLNKTNNTLEEIGVFSIHTYVFKYKILKVYRRILWQNDSPYSTLIPDYYCPLTD